MFMLTNERIHRRSKVKLVGRPFLQGELYVTKYMGLPTVVTVLDRTPDTVTLWFGTITVEEFNQRVLFRMGRRCRFLGMWLPWARCQPERIIELELDDSLGSNARFWNNRNEVLCD